MYKKHLCSGEAVFWRDLGAPNPPRGPPQGISPGESPRGVPWGAAGCPQGVPGKQALWGARSSPWSGEAWVMLILIGAFRNHISKLFQD